MPERSDVAIVDPNDTLAALLNRVRAALAAEVDQALMADADTAAYGLTYAQCAVLAALHHHETQCAGEMCKLLAYDRGAMSRMLDRLEDKGMIRRVRRPGERRMIALEITREGERIVPRVRATVSGVLSRQLRGISKTEVRQMEKVLRRMLANS
jgi:DNA-binding MarR family transcriptional regulator